ncbi:MAG: transposase [Candidatus Onthovivens sp.]|nr:transposase [Candidatus Onthovivens sp.]
MKISLEKKREIILVEHLEYHILLCCLTRKYGISQNELYHIKSRYLLHGEVVFKKHYRNFTNEFKTKLVKEYLEGKSTLDQIALKNNIDKGTLGNWIKRYNDNNGIIITMKKGRNKNY